MRRWFRRLAGLCLLAALLVILALLRAPEERLTDAQGARVYVMDGDSLRVGPRIVRLEGVDAVELHQLCKAADGSEWSCGIEARSALQGLVAQGGLRCLSRAGDRYGRALARCSARDVPDIAEALVARGWALSGTGRSDGRYVAQQLAAKAAGQGIWRGPFARPADWRATHPRQDAAD